MDDSMVADPYPPQPSDHASSPKPSVSRGARACTVCRQAKMKCVGAEDDGAKPCQRCRRSNAQCIFEKHRRGRKPGSKLSEQAKMLRKLEKGSHTQKVAIKTHDDPPPSTQMPYPVSDSRSIPTQDQFPPPPRFSPREPVYVPSQAPRIEPQVQAQAQSQPQPQPQPSSQNLNPFPTLTSPYTAHPPRPFPLPSASAPPPASPHSPMDQDDNDHNNDDDDDRSGSDSDRDNDTEVQHIYPAAMLERENRKNNYFNTVLGARDMAKTGSYARRLSTSGKPMDASDSPQMPPHVRTGDAAMPRPFPPRYAITLPTVQDPVQAGIVSLAEVNAIFDHLFRHLNPFINLFDPQLHTPTYVRERCPFLYTILIMAGCKFWKQDKFRAVQKLVEEFSLRSFVEGWKRVEVVQAYMCMTYWKEPDDTRTWMFIGCAARLAVELGLNAYTPVAHASETEQQWLERRNRERTYLVLWVHDRSLSMQTGREWMLPDTDLIRTADTWHLMSRLLPIDVVVSAQVALRRCAAEVTDMFYLRRGGRPPADVNYDVLLRCANYRLQMWADIWMDALDRFHGSDFHKALLNFFKLHVRLFLNSIGLFTPQASNSAVTVCYTSAVETLCLVATEFTKLDMLRYGQDSVSVMTAYSAVSLLKLLRNWHELNEIPNVYDIINSTAQAYEAAAKSMIATSSHTIEYHGRFLRALVVKDQSTRARGRKKEPSGSNSNHGSSGGGEGGTAGGGGGGGGGGGTGGMMGLPGLGSGAMANLGVQANVPETLVINQVGHVKKVKVGKTPLAAGMGFGMGTGQVKQQMVSPPLGVQVPQSQGGSSQQQQKGQQAQNSTYSRSVVVNGLQNGTTTHGQHQRQQQQQQQQQQQHSHTQQAMGPQTMVMYHHGVPPSNSGTTPALPSGSSHPQMVPPSQPPPPPSHQAHLAQQHQQHQLHMHQQQQQQQPMMQSYTSWGFPASPVLPSHPLISPEGEIPPMELQGSAPPEPGVGVGGGMNASTGGIDVGVGQGLGGPHPNAVAGPGPNSLTAQQLQASGGPGGGNGPYANGSGSVGQPGVSASSLQMEAGGGANGEAGMGEAAMVGGAPGTLQLENHKMEVAYWYAVHAELGYGNGTTSFMGMPPSGPKPQTPLNPHQMTPYRAMEVPHAGYPPPDTHPGYQQPPGPPPPTNPPPSGRTHHVSTQRSGQHHMQYGHVGNLPTG